MIGARGAAEADLFVGYDSSAAAYVGGSANLQVRAYNAVASSNAINRNSGTPARIRIVGFKQSNEYNYKRTSNGGFVNWMNSNDSRIADIVAAGYGAQADLVTYICESTDDGAAAVASQPGRYSSFDEEYVTTGNYLAHETSGHNYGCDHRGGKFSPKTIMLHNYCDGGGANGYFTNPNIWLNGSKLQGDGSCLGGAVAGGDNAYLLSTAAQGVADRYERITYGSYLGAVQYRWQFNQAAGAAPAGTVVSDSIASAAATVRGQGATFTGTGLRLPGGTSCNTAADSIAAYLDLPNGLFSAMPNFSVEIWATPVTGANWMRVIDIGRTVEAGDGLGVAGEYTGAPGSPAPGATSGSDEIGLSAATNSTSLNNQRLIAGIDGSTQSSDSTLATTAGQMYHYAITFTDTSAGGTVSWYRNGTLVRSLNVAFHSADLEDVNNWLGRSMWSGDQMANIEFHDVRIQSAALREEQVMGNYLIGPHDAVSTKWASDAFGISSFFSGSWEFGAAVDPSRDYETVDNRLRTPANSANHTFPGKSLTLTGGTLLLKGTAANTTTMSDLRLSGGTIVHAGGSANQAVEGNLSVINSTQNHVRGANGTIDLKATISGFGGILYTESPVALWADNTGFTGQTVIGDGRFSTLLISSEENLGANPPFYGGAWLELNRGILQTTATMTLDDPNRGIRIGPSGGFFRPNGGTTLTIASPLTSPAAGDTPQTTPLSSNPTQGIFFKDGAGTLVLTSPNNSHNAEMQILQGELRLDGAGRINNGDHWMPITLNSTLNYNTSAEQYLRGAISGTGTLLKNGTGTLILRGANTMTGAVTVNAGTLYANTGNAANNRALSFVSGITVNNGGTLRASANGLFGWDGTQARPVTINTGGIMTTDAANTDVNVGTITLNGGTLAGFSSPAWGSWNLKRVSGSKLLVTENSIVSAPNVGLGTTNSIDVSSGKILTFSGTIHDLTSEGVCALVKSNGIGMLVLAGSNTYTGPTMLNAGTTLVNGSLGITAVTVASAATLGGTGSVGGPTTIDGVHSPGNSAGTQSFGSTLDYGSTSRLKWELASNSVTAGAFDKVTATGAVTVTSGAKLDVVLNAAGSGVALNDTFWTQPRSWTFLTGSSIAGSFTLGSVTHDPGGRQISEYGSFSLVHGAGTVTLHYTPNNAIVTPPYELWAQEHFGENWDSPAIAGDNADPDKDGLSNLLEYALGSDPKVSSASAVPQSTTTSGKLMISFTRNSAATDLTLSVIAADDLTSTWTEIARSVNGAAFTVLTPGAVVSESGTGSVKDVETTDIHLISDPAHLKRFMRLEVKR